MAATNLVKVTGEGSIDGEYIDPALVAAIEPRDGKCIVYLAGGTALEIDETADVVAALLANAGTGEAGEGGGGA